MGANIASEVAEEKFCETTIGELFWPESELGDFFLILVQQINSAMLFKNTIALT
jgi:glycerol-3-phosphate dehydrogenase